jgi:signal transduction histidine kinase
VDRLRTHRLDLALALLAVVVLVTSLGESTEHVRWGSAIMALAVVVQLGRRWRPPAATLACFAMLALGSRVTPQISATMFLSILVCFGVTGTLASRWAAVVGWAAGCAAMLVAMVGNPYVEGASDIALTLTFCTIIWAAGLLAAERGRAAGAAHARVVLVESVRDQDVAEATRHERDRIAGELHDIVSHGLSIVILQTVAARMALSDRGIDEPDVDRRLGAVESTARSALEDMRRLLDLLRPDGAAAAETTTPSSGLAQLPVLVDQARAAGLPLEAQVDTGAEELPAGLDAAAYRIVQEALTNVLKHAPGARTRVSVNRGETVLEIAVRNTGGRAATDPPRGAAYGLIGMRQRAALYGGHLEAGAHADGYEVRAVFPVGREAT